MNFIYLGTLLISIAGLAAIDFRHKLAFARNAKAATIAIGIPYLIFLSWDAAGIATKIFFKGESKYLTGVMIAPEFPLEELFFLFLLCYCTLVVATWFDRKRR